MNNPQPTPSPMEDSRELRGRIAENVRWVEFYRKVVDMLNDSFESSTFRAARQVLKEHEQRLAQLQQLESEE